MNRILHILSVVFILGLYSCSDFKTEMDHAADSPAFIQGTVTDPVGNPLEKIRITLEAKESASRQTSYTSSQGHFRCDLPPFGENGYIILNITIEDIDGTDNGGLFETKTDKITIFEDNYERNPLIIELPTYRLTHATVSENNPQS